MEDDWLFDGCDFNGEKRTLESRLIRYSKTMLSHLFSVKSLPSPISQSVASRQVASRSGRAVDGAMTLLRGGIVVAQQQVSSAGGTATRQAANNDFGRLVRQSYCGSETPAKRLLSLSLSLFGFSARKNLDPSRS